MPHVTVPSQPTEVIYVVTTSTTGPFTFAFSYFVASDVRVAHNGTEIAGANFVLTPTVTAEQGYEGGSITLNSAVGAGTLRVWRDVPSSRTTDFPTAGPFDVTALNTFLDKQFAILQQIETELERTLGLDETEGSTLNRLPPKATRANKVLMFDADGQPLEGPTSADIAAAQTYATNASTSASAAAASATTAQTWASLVPTPSAPDALKFLRVNSGGTAYEVTTVSASGDVVGPASATDRALALYNGTTGKIIKNGPALGTSGHVLVSAGAGSDPAFGQVGSAGIAANAVGVAKLAREGSAGHVLYSNGAGADPSYGALPVAGEVNAGANVGTGVSVYKDKSALNLRFRSFLVSVTNAASGSGLTLSDVQITAASWTQNADDLTLNLTLTRTFTGGGGT